MGQSLWTFEGFRTANGNGVVQEWFWGEIDDEGRDAIRDRVTYLALLERHLWKEPHFKRLDSDLGEIRTKTSRGALRVYGFFRIAHHFLFLSANYKSVNNDRVGKNAAKDRLKRFRQGLGDFHEFDFEDRHD